MDDELSAGQPPLSDSQHNWASRFTGIPTRPADAAAGSGANSDQPAQATDATAADFQTLRPQCDAWLSAHKFTAEDAEVVPGDMQCWFYLDDKIVKIEDVHAALIAAFPALSQMDDDVWPWLRSRWDLERTQALTFAGKMPAQGSLSRPSPSGAPPKDGLIAHAGDGQTYWQPAPVQTWGAGGLVPATQGWVKDYFDFYELAAPSGTAAADACRFNGADDTLDNVVAVLAMQAALAGYAIDAGGARAAAATIVESQRSADVVGKQVGDRTPVAPPPSDMGPPGNKGRQWGLSLATQTSGHWKLTSTDKVADNVMQCQFSLTDVHHPENQTGLEPQAYAQVSFNMKTGDLQIQGGLQGTDVLLVWGHVQLQLVGGASAGVSSALKSGGSISGVFQIQAGPQVAITIGPIQLSLGAVAGATISKDAPTFDAGGVLQAQYQWDKDPAKPPPPPPTPEIDIHELTAMTMDDLLIALDRIAADGHLAKVQNASHDERVETALETVKQLFNDSDKQKVDGYYASVGKLQEQDQSAIRKYIPKHLTGG